MSDYRRLKPGPYQEKVTSFSWEVPDRYNIATLTGRSAVSSCARPSGTEDGSCSGLALLGLAREAESP
jgi:hypothetical protein